MAVFVLETEVVSSAASTINSLASELNSLSSTVSGYDTTCEDGFNFAGAKNVIAGNIDACATKMKNTAKVMEAVVSSHTQLQNGGGTSGDSSAQSQAGDTSSTGAGSYAYTGGGGYSSYGGGGGSSGTKKKKKKKKKEEEEDKTGEVKTELTTIGYAYPDMSSLTDDSKELLKDTEFKYDDKNYAKIGNRYVIACDSSIANVGDVLRFTQNDGTVVECVVGVVTESDKYEHTINFLVNQQASSIQATEVTKNLLANNTKVENIGTLADVRKLDTQSNQTQSSNGNDGTTGDSKTGGDNNGTVRV